MRVIRSHHPHVCSVWGKLVWVDKVTAINGKINGHQGAADKSNMLKVPVYICAPLAIYAVCHRSTRLMNGPI